MKLFKRKEDKEVYLVKVLMDRYDQGFTEEATRVHNDVDRVYDNVCAADLFVISEIERYKIICKSLGATMIVNKDRNALMTARITVYYENDIKVVITYNVEERVVE